MTSLDIILISLHTELGLIREVPIHADLRFLHRMATEISDLRDGKANLTCPKLKHDCTN